MLQFCILMLQIGNCGALIGTSVQLLEELCKKK
jgi:hypothetical protein